jgi:hypothetical protein
MPFEVTVFHSQPLLMSVIQVICNNKMVAVAHLIASDQLPLPTQVSDTLFLSLSKVHVVVQRQMVETSAANNVVVPFTLLRDDNLL